ncbi:HAD family hydrolase [Streptomyces sp. NPDC015346]|uniref:HAD family hydrolase n=1 Tax=Streptomyces sp. NPDC015346 TaxID=3364954 RepID=UPI0036FA8065
MKGVLFDFSGTLFRIESTEDWLRAAVGASGTAMAEAELAECAARLEAAGAQPGGAYPARLPARLETLWHERDLDGERHRAAYTALAREAGLPSPELAEALYDRHRDPAAWLPYPDAESTLRELRGRAIPVAVVSNIGWDLRPVFRHHGLDPLVDTYLLSYEYGVQKPDPRLFQAACDELGLHPRHVLMVGDHPAADGGAEALGCAVHFVDPLAVDRRPDALTAVLGLV